MLDSKFTAMANFPSLIPSEAVTCTAKLEFKWSVS